MNKSNENEYTFSFVILHYLAYKETINCVESIIKNIDSENYSIIIVDNASPNESGIILNEHFSDNSRVKVLMNNKNLGFAKGNNIGFIYAKNVLRSDFIIMTNNDTLFMQQKFTRLIADEYQSSKFAVMGPKIILPDKTFYSNPMRINPMTLKELKTRKLYIKCLLSLNYLSVENIIIGLKNIINTKKTLQLKNENILKQKVAFSNKRIENVQLHGSCLVFSKEFIKSFDGLDDRTFMYMEEEILFLQLRINNMKSVYNPNIEIIHLEDAATNSVNVKKKLKRRFIYKNSLNSMKVIEKILNQELL